MRDYIPNLKIGDFLTWYTIQSVTQEIKTYDSYQSNYTKDKLGLS